MRIHLYLLNNNIFGFFFYLRDYLRKVFKNKHNNKSMYLSYNQQNCL